ncbi:MAG: insulinase family protein [Candidatus Hydrogenedentes bacterium]|nr:insulinase family protein [Candidatus Hydrogenedentota bacterium]
MRYRFLTVMLGLVLFFAVLCAPAQAEYRQISEPGADDPMAVQIFQLDNGLTVYLTENHQTPRFYAEIAVRAGSKNDPAETTGLAHYLEHLLFKGTERIGTLDFAKEQPHLDRITELYEEHFREEDPEKRKAIYAEINKESQQAAQYAIPNEFDRLYRSMGAQGLNAHTWLEETVYKVDLPSNRLEQWAAIEAERFVAPVFRLFQPELEIVYEEKNRSMDNKNRIITEAVDKLLYKNHPYGQQTTLGEVEHLKKPSLANIYKFYHTYYVPNNMAIFISGDISIDETMRLIDTHFSSWEKKPLPKKKTWKEKPLKGAERVTVQYEGEEYVLLAFRTAPRSHKDAETLKVIDMVLSNSVAGLIDLNLNQAQKVRSAGSYPQLNNDYGSQFFWGIPKDGQTLEEVEKLLLEQVELVKKGDFEDWIIPAIITDFKKTRKAGLESDESRVSFMREAYLGYEDWDHAVEEITRLEKITKADVVRVANKYFDKGYVAGYRKDAQHEVPSIEKPAIDAIAIDPTRQSEFAKSILAMPVKPIEPVFVDPAKDYRIEDDPNGIRYYHVANPVNDLFALTFTVEVGSIEDNRIGAATQLLDKSGTSKFSAEDLKKEWYKLGTSFGIGAGEHETNITIAGLDENFEASVALLMDLLNNPSATQETMNELIQIILVNREDAKKDANSIHAALVEFNRYGEDSAYRRMLPTEAVKKLSIEELHGIIKSLLRYKHTVQYTGSLPLERVKEVIRKQYPVSAPLKDTPPYHRKTVRRSEQPEIYFFNKEMAQAQIRLDFGSEVFDETQTVPIQLFNSYFGGGMTGVVFQELREARALAYAAGARYVTADRAGDENVMVGAMGTQADKGPEALAAFVSLMDEMPMAPERFAPAQDSLIENYRTGKLGFREIVGTVRLWERLGLQIDPRRQRFEKVLSANADTMLTFYKDKVQGKTKLVSIVGDKTKMDMAKIAQFGQLEEVGLDRLFAE